MIIDKHNISQFTNSKIKHNNDDTLDIIYTLDLFNNREIKEIHYISDNIMSIDARHSSLEKIIIPSYPKALKQINLNFSNVYVLPTVDFNNVKAYSVINTKLEKEHQINFLSNFDKDYIDNLSKKHNDYLNKIAYLSGNI